MKVDRQFDVVGDAEQLSMTLKGSSKKCQDKGIDTGLDLKNETTRQCHKGMSRELYKPNYISDTTQCQSDTPSGIGTSTGDGGNCHRNMHRSIPDERGNSDSERVKVRTWFE
jgi:hypothetical protein